MAKKQFLLKYLVTSCLTVLGTSQVYAGMDHIFSSPPVGNIGGKQSVDPSSDDKHYDVGHGDGGYDNGGYSDSAPLTDVSNDAHSTVEERQGSMDVMVEGSPETAEDAGIDLSEEEKESLGRVRGLITQLEAMHEKRERGVAIGSTASLFKELFSYGIEFDQKELYITGVKPESPFPLVMAAKRMKLLSPSLQLGLETVLNKLWAHKQAAELTQEQTNTLIAQGDFSAVQERGEAGRHVITLTLPKKAVQASGLDKSAFLSQLINWEADHHSLSLTVAFDDSPDLVASGEFEQLNRRFFTALVNTAPSSEDAANLLSKSSRPEKPMELVGLSLEEIQAAIRKKDEHKLLYQMGIEFGADVNQILAVHGDEGMPLTMDYIRQGLKPYLNLQGQTAYERLRKKMYTLLSKKARDNKLTEFLSSKDIVFTMEPQRGKNKDTTIVVFTVPRSLFEAFDLGDMGDDQYAHYGISFPEDGENIEYYKFTNKELTPPASLQELKVFAEKG